MSQPDPLHCAFCGAPWDSPVFLSATVYARPREQNQLSLLACRACQATLPEAHMQQRLDDAIGQVRPGAPGSDREPPPVQLDLLCCAFCGEPWCSGLFFGPVVYARAPGQDRVPMLACYVCHGTRTNEELQRQFDAAIGQTPPARERPDV